MLHKVTFYHTIISKKQKYSLILLIYQRFPKINYKPNFYTIIYFQNFFTKVFKKVFSEDCTHYTIFYKEVSWMYSLGQTANDEAKI